MTLKHLESRQKCKTCGHTEEQHTQTIVDMKYQKKQGYCMMKGENEQQLRENKLTGKQNTDHVCSNYIKLFAK